MNHKIDTRLSDTRDDPREICKWARAYARNRSLGVVVGMTLFIVLWVAMCLPPYYGGMAYRAHQWPLVWLCIAIWVIGMASVLYLSVPRWGGKLTERIVERLYAGEGLAQLMPPISRRRRWIGGIVGAVFGGSIVTCVALGVLGLLPQVYMMPVSALYSVPFLLALWLLIRPAAGQIFLLWPALYALHAILIVAGVPILFAQGPWESLNMLIPVAGYGLLTGLIAHVYSRFALRKLRQAAGGSDIRGHATEESQP